MIKASKVVGKIAKYTITAVLVAYCLSLLIPLLWLLINSLKDEFEFTVNPFWLPEQWNFDNYTKVFEFLKVELITEKGVVEYNFVHLILNSLVRSMGIPLVMVVVQTLTAYTLSKYRFFGSKFMYMAGLVIMIMPLVGNFPSAMMINKTLGVYDNMFLNIITAPSTVFSLNFMILYSAFKAIPWDYAEAAFIDGAGHWRVLLTIMIPMIIPTCVVLFVLGFLGTWNDYATPLIWLPSYPNLAYGLYLFQWNASIGAEGASTPMLLTAFVVVMTPMVALYLATQKLIVQKFMVGGLKG